MSLHEWSKKPIKNVLLDINGVLFESGEDQAIKGSVDAMRRLVENNFNFCLVTNECTTAKANLAKKLNNFGYDCIEPCKIISPAPVASRYLVEHDLIPHLHVWDGVLDDFSSSIENMKQQPNRRPNCLVVGDVMDKMSRNFMDESLEVILNCNEHPTILSLGSGRYYKDAGRLRMDTGAYVAAFEFCLGVKAINVGKPSPEFFGLALKVVDGTPDDTIMIGDDLISDVGGAQEAGMRAFLVKTGKYKPSDETNPKIRPDHVFNDLSVAVDALIEANK